MATIKFQRILRSKRQNLFLVLLVFVFGFIAVGMLRISYEFFGDFPISDVFNIPDDVTCYHKDFENPDPLEDIPKHAIFLISSSCQSTLSTQEECAIESISRIHSDKRIIVFVNRPLTECKCTKGILEGLKSIPSLQFVQIQIDKFVEDTPLKGIFTDEFLNIGLQRHKRVIEILKFVTLYKFGGVVIDLDMILAKSISFLGLNYVMRVNKTMLGSAMVGIRKDSLLAKQLMPLVLDNLKNQSLEKNIHGGKALTDAFKEMCYDHPRPGCSDFRIYDEKFLYPYNESASYMYSQQAKLNPIAYGYYIWDPHRVIRRRTSLYIQLMKEYCPSVYSYLLH